jgi:F420-non-reducing hydrogenase iron-sulfur subunit
MENAQNTSGAESGKKPKILILATEACAYPGANYVSQTHTDYPTNAYIVRILSPAVFPEEFYLRCFEKGIDGILVMACGHECPYPGAFERLTKRLAAVQEQMKERGMDIRRLRVCAICTVCAKAFLKEVNQMNELLAELAAG